MINDNIVLVGGIGAWKKVKPKEVEIARQVIAERRELMRLLSDFGIPYKPVSVSWPRNSYVFHDNRIYTRKEHSYYADGGMILAYPNFTLASSDVSLFPRQKDPHSLGEVMNKLERLYGENVAVLPSPRHVSAKYADHIGDIDLVLLPIPERGVLFVDESYDHGAQRSVDEVCERFNLKKQLVSQDGFRPCWPCNSFIFKTENISMIANSASGSDFLNRIRDLGIELITLPFSGNNYYNGSIRCATNSLPKNYPRNIESLL